MAVTFTSRSTVQVGPNAYRVSWTSDNPSCRVFLNGKYLGPTTGGSWVFTLDSLDARGQIDVIDDEVSLPESQPAQWLLQWPAVSAVAAYRVERYDGAAWQLVTELRSDARTRYRYLTPALANALTAHQVRVTSIGDDGNEASPVTVAKLSVRHPDPPDATYSYDDGTNAITIAAA